MWIPRRMWSGRGGCWGRGTPLDGIFARKVLKAVGIGGKVPPVSGEKRLVNYSIVPSFSKFYLAWFEGVKGTLVCMGA